MIPRVYPTPSGTGHEVRQGKNGPTLYRSYGPRSEANAKRVAAELRRRDVPHAHTVTPITPNPPDAQI